MPVATSIDDDDDERDYSAEKSINCSNPFSPFTDGLPRLSFSYHKLPPHSISLSIIKLDGSSFDVQIFGTATVGELKDAVEDVFAQSPQRNQGEISWAHVWWHFCLSYQGRKLINDKDYIRNFGIKDGDQLHFIRHLSINYNLKRKPKRETAVRKEQLLLCAGPGVYEKYDDGGGYRNATWHDEESNGDQPNRDSNSDWNNKDRSSDQFDNDIRVDQHNEDSKYENDAHRRNENFIGPPEFKLAHFLKGWVSYSNTLFVGRTKSVGKTRPSRFSDFFKLGSKVTFTRI